MNLIYNKNKQGKIDFLSTIKRSYCPLSKDPRGHNMGVSSKTQPLFTLEF